MREEEEEEGQIPSSFCYKQYGGNNDVPYNKEGLCPI